MESASEHCFFGVATSAYQSEGGYNGPGEPRTNWATAEESGDVSPTGSAAEFWLRYQEDFDRAASMGCDSFRMGIEWSRVQPGPAKDLADPAFDEEALRHYAKMLAACRARGMEPFVTLHHFVHPEWLGIDIWIADATPQRFAKFAEHAMAAINRLLVTEHGTAPLRYYVTINEPNMLALNTHIARQFPGGKKRGMAAMSDALDGMLAGHVLVYGALKALHQREGWPVPVVGINTYTSDLYWSDKVLFDLLMVRERKITKSELTLYFKRQVTEFQRAFREARLPLHKDVPYRLGAVVKAVAHWLGSKRFDPLRFHRFFDALEQAEADCVLDFAGIDYYDPFLAHLFRLPVFWDHEFKNRSVKAWVMNTITSKWWDWRVLPRGLHFFCELYSRDLGKPILIAENGMALRRRPDNSKTPRRDRMTRSQFLRLFMHEVVRIRADGIPLLGYLHWSLFDNYEWGSYTPRFGLFAIDYAVNRERKTETDSGDRPSEAYRELIAEARKKAGKPTDK